MGDNRPLYGKQNYGKFTKRNMERVFLSCNLPKKNARFVKFLNYLQVADKSTRRQII